MEFELGDMVYLKTDKQQDKRIVTAVCKRATGYSYCLNCGMSESWHYDFEMSKERDIILATTN